MLGLNFSVVFVDLYVVFHPTMRSSDVSLMRLLLLHDDVRGVDVHLRHPLLQLSLLLKTIVPSVSAYRTL